MTVTQKLMLVVLSIGVVACQESVTNSLIPDIKTTEASQHSELIQRFRKLDIDVENVQPSNIPGLMEVQTSQGILFSSPNGDHFLAGTLYSLDNNGRYEDVIEKRLAPLNAQRIEEFEDSMIVFKAQNEKHVITVFTDTSCGYCSKLHSQMNDYNQLGITVRYLAYPRAGDNSDVANQMARIWEAKDPKQAMSASYSTQLVEPPTANSLNIIGEHYKLGQSLSVNGTPAIFTTKGMQIGGYLAPQTLLVKLDAEVMQ